MSSQSSIHGWIRGRSGLHLVPSQSSIHGQIHGQLDVKSVFDSWTNSRPKWPSFGCQVSLQFMDKFTANWMSSQSSIHGRIRGRSGLHLGAKSVFNSRTNSQPIWCQLNLRFTDKFTANWVTSLSLVHGTKMANSLEKKSQNGICIVDWEVSVCHQTFTSEFSKWPLIWNHIAFNLHIWITVPFVK